MNIRAHYRFLVYRYEKQPEWCTVQCDVIAQTEKSYRIRLLAPNVRGHKYKDCIWVRKDSVIMPPPEVDTTRQWWHD